MSYSFAGTSVLKGELKVRFANSDARAKQLSKLGDTDVNIVQLPHAMDKAEAVAYLLESGFAKDIKCIYRDDNELFFNKLDVICFDPNRFRLVA